MDEEARLDAKIKQLQNRKQKLHVHQQEKLYRAVGEYFVDHNGQHAINDHNYKDFMLMSKQNWNQLHTAANHMYRDIKGKWCLQPGDQGSVNRWLVRHFRDDITHHHSGSTSQRTGKGRVPLGGHLYTFREIGQKFHLRPMTVNIRWRQGARGKELVRPLNKAYGKKRGEHVLYLNGKPFTLGTLSRLYNLSESLIMNRYYKGARDYKLVRPLQHHHSHGSHHVTPFESVEHKRVRFRGKICTLAELGHRYNVKVTTLGSRYYAGKRGKDLVMPPLRRHRVHLNVNGKDYTFQSLSRASGINISTLNNRYYNYHLRGNELIHPGLLGAQFTINHKTYTLPKLAIRYRTTTRHILRTIKTRYQHGHRDHDLILPFEMNRGPISFRGHHYTPEELGRQYDIPVREIMKRYYGKKDRGKDLVRPLVNPNQLKLTDAPVKKTRPRTKRRPIQSGNTQAAYQELVHRPVVVHGSVVGQPRYQQGRDGKHLYTSFLVIAGHQDSRVQQMFPGGFVTCVAKDGEAQDIHHKIIYYSHVTVDGDIKAAYYKGHRQNELIVRDIRKEA